MKISTEAKNAYTEVLTILYSLPESDFNKIPENLIDLLRQNQNENYEFDFDINLSLNAQKISYKAQIILAIIFRDYLATNTQREKIIKYENYQREKLNKEALEKYNPKDIFLNNDFKELGKQNQNEQNNNQDNEIKKELIEYKKYSIWNKILNKIKKFLKIDR